MLFVLIETLWNVKAYCKEHDCQTGNCINRNIVECKDFRHDINPQDVAVLIETLWNVKMLSQQFYRNGYIVLIETLWNVKLLPRQTIQQKCWY